MKVIFLKEITAFFSSLIAYMAVGTFLVLMGLILWVFPDTSILSYGQASLNYFFDTAPWVLMFLIPAVTMRSFSEEKLLGTFELLATKPLRDWQIVLGKYFACVFLVIIAVIPTIIYAISIYELASPVGNIDGGGIAGSYIGLLLLATVFAAIGLMASALSSNQIVAFILAVLLCFVCFACFDLLSRLSVFYANGDYFVQSLGIQHHYVSMSRGVIDSRDVIYFISANVLFLSLTHLVLGSRRW